MATETPDPIQWVNNAQLVEARFAHGGVRAEGTAVAYVAEPSVIIQTDSGEHVTWALSLTQAVGECGEPTDALRYPAKCGKRKDHFGERHTADIGGGTYTWGYVPHPEDAT